MSSHKCSEPCALAHGRLRQNAVKSRALISQCHSLNYYVEFECVLRICHAPSFLLAVWLRERCEKSTLGRGPIINVRCAHLSRWPLRLWVMTRRPHQIVPPRRSFLVFCSQKSIDRAEERSQDHIHNLASRRAILYTALSRSFQRWRVTCGERSSLQGSAEKGSEGAGF